MPCAEFTNAIAWFKQGSKSLIYPVKAYFTKHYGYTDAHVDSVHYASGDVFVVDTPVPHLKGTLKVAKNTEKDGEMVETTNLTYDVEMFPDGKVSYLMRINGDPVGGLPPIKVQATCVNNALLTATTASEVVTIGVARKPAISAPPK